MKNRSHGRVLSPMQFEVVPLPVLPAHDRVPAVPARELPDYLPFGDKARLVRAFAPTQPAEVQHG